MQPWAKHTSRALFFLLKSKYCMWSKAQSAGGSSELQTLLKAEPPFRAASWMSPNYSYSPGTKQFLTLWFQWPGPKASCRKIFVLCFTSEIKHEQCCCTWPGNPARFHVCDSSAKEKQLFLTSHLCEHLIKTSSSMRTKAGGDDLLLPGQPCHEKWKNGGKKSNCFKGSNKCWAHRDWGRQEHPVHSVISRAPPRTQQEAKGRRKQRQKIFCRNDEPSWAKCFLCFKCFHHVLSFCKLLISTGRPQSRFDSLKQALKMGGYPNATAKTKENAA